MQKAASVSKGVKYDTHERTKHGEKSVMKNSDAISRRLGKC